MTKARTVKKKIAGRTKRIVGEILGDQNLDLEGRNEERSADREREESGEDRPIGDLDRLT